MKFLIIDLTDFLLLFIFSDTDHTAYTVQTAGSEGFLNLLPIYLDHLIYPTLTVCRSSMMCY